jgi:deoxyribodipyrimidine photolyase-related protein
LKSSALDGFDPKQDLVWMAEVRYESTKVWSHRTRTALFLSAMRHFAEALKDRGWKVEYRKLQDAENLGRLELELEAAVKRIQPSKVIMAEAGEWSVQEALAKISAPWEIRPDRHFLATREDFTAHASGRKQLRMEFFYREMRKKSGFLMDPNGQPVGGEWNFDHDNRESFGKAGPQTVPAPQRFLPDAITQEVIALVNEHFPDHPGELAAFDWPVTAEEAREALHDFVQNRLADFGRWQDAMWTNEPWLYHSRLSAAMNLKLLDPREVIQAAEAAYRIGAAPLPAVEGFIRQILGWREYVRGVYWHFMPDYVDKNALQANNPLPQFYWDGKTDMACLSDALGQTLRFGYAHHIQRLMVTGLFSLLLGVNPQEIHRWYLAVYVDAVEWVELPNTLGMSQYADGGIMASKPYVATGKYIQRMSNYCKGCPYDPGESLGPKACPFTTLYWDFLINHRETLRGNRRMDLQLRNVDRLAPAKIEAIQKQAVELRERFARSAT